jgi:protein TonB
MNNMATDNAAYAAMPGNAPPTSLRTRPDNLATMLFVAALFHGVLILGVSFTAGNPASSSADADTASMEVVLLRREYEKRPDSDEAEYLAQQNLTGSGNTEEDAALRIAYGRDANPAMPGPERDGADESPQQVTEQSNAQQLLYARTPNSSVMTEKQRRDEVTNAAALRTGMPGTANSVEILATPDTETVLKGALPRQMIISANTRESRIAAYLDGWKRRVERVGTINFPFSALNEPGIRNPVLEVSIAANGKLTEVIILTGSGNRELDMAAVNILRMAAPFDQFPEYLRNDYDALKFSYEWQFTGNNVGRMTVP